MIAAIVAAAGSGERFGAPIPKALIQLGDRTLLEHAVSSLSAVVDQIVVTAPAGFEDQIRALVGDAVTVVTGGATRSDSVFAQVLLQLMAQILFWFTMQRVHWQLAS